MKNTPKKGRPDKTFTFKSFNDHLAEININLVRKVDTGQVAGIDRDDGDDGTISYFFSTLSKFGDFNCTADFEQLKKRLGGFSSFRSLVQVVHRKDELFQIVLEVLEKPESQASDVALELIASLAQDIGQDFYPYFEPTFDSLTKLMDTQDPRLLENTFMTLATLFKLLWRCMVRDVKKVFRLYAKLFSYQRQEYIWSFAAQSFTYLARKVPNKLVLIEIILKEVDSDPNIVSGVSNLFFEIVKGVPKKLHSCATEFLNTILQCFAENHCESSNVQQCIQESFNLIADHIDTEESEVLCASLLSVCESLIQSPPKFKPIVSLLLFIVSHKRGQLIKECDSMIEFTIASLQAMFDVKDCMDVLLRLTSSLLNNLYLDIEPSRRRKLIKTAFDTNITPVQAHSFIESLFANRFFESDILPILLERCYKSLLRGHVQSSDENQDSPHQFESTIEILFKLVTYKRPLPVLETLPTFQTYSLDFSQIATDDVLERMVDNLMKILLDPQDWNLVRKVVNVLPHIHPLATSFASSGLITLIYKIMATLSTIIMEDEPLLLHTILSEAIYSLSLIRSVELFSEFKADFFKHLFETCPGNPIILQGFVFFLQYAHFADQKNVFDREFFESLFFTYLQDNLSHPKSQVRFLTLIAINLFDLPMQPNETGSIRQSIFSICLEAEMVPLTVHNYREKLRLLSLLECGLVGKCLPLPSLSGQTYDLAPLHYLLGTLYYNFSLIWQPLQKMIQNYGRGLKDRSAFWKVVGKHFRESQTYNTTKTLVKDTTYWPRLNQTSEANPRPDYLNHQILLLQTFTSIAEVIEPHGEEVAGWMFRFLENEADSIKINFKAEEDISLVTTSPEAGEASRNESMEQESKDDDDHANKDEDDEVETVQESEKKTENKVVWKALSAFLELFASFRNPRKFDTEQRLFNLYNSLLQHINPTVQKAALNCLLTYNDQNITPYQENLQRLLDDTTFKTEILLFGSRGPDPEQDLVKTHHRSHVMPYVMRILYGKMLSKTGAKTAGKSNMDVRRSIVFRFLASCEENEIMLFIKLAFHDLVPFFSMEMKELYEALEKINIHKCIPLRHVQSELKTLALMLIHFGNLVTDLLRTFFKILLIKASFVKVLLAKRSLLRPGCITRLKAVRTECFKLTEKFFTLFENYAFTKEEINHLCDSLINPMLVNMANESLETPSPVLRLLNCWSENPRYFVLLVKKSSDSDDLTPLSCIIDLYSSDKASTGVIEYISSLLCNLLSYENYSPMEADNTDDPEGPFLDVDGLVDESYDEKYKAKTGDLNFGTQIVIPFISAILDRIRKNLQSRMKSKSRRKEAMIPPNEATILTHLSELVAKEDDCVVLARLLIDSIEYRRDEEEDSICKTLEAINNLVKKIKNKHKQFVAKLSKLFEIICGRNARVELCKILSSMGENAPALKPLSEVVTMLNAYNPRNPEEPEYIVRGEGFSKARKIIQEMKEDSLNVDFFKVLIHNCCFFIQNAEDIGLRESSSTCLQVIIQHLSSFEKATHFKSIVIDLLFLKQVKKGMKDANEQARHEFITVLTDLVKYGKGKHPLLDQLSLLSNEDPELDFWVNMRHIQLHRRIRALARLSSNHELLAKFSPQILFDFILSVAVASMGDLKKTKYEASAQQAVELIGSICRHLPWPMYEKLLRTYLKRLITDQEHHKATVRILCSIMANFNFDLRKSTNNIKTSVYSEQTVQSSDELGKKHILNAEMATRVHKVIIDDILPKLHECLYKLSYSDYEYDNIRSEFSHEDEIQRIPLATAMVKLLACIPVEENVFEQNIRSIFIRLCNFLKSRMESIREASRKTLCKIMEILGHKYLFILIHEMKSILTRGYRFHVLTFTLYIVLEAMSPSMKSGDLDESSVVLIEIFHKELFTDIAEEKSVGKITSKWKEAKKSKSYAGYRLLGKFISSQIMIKTMLPLKTVLDETHSPKIVKKVTICMEKFFQGLTENTGLDEFHLLSFILDTLEDKIPQLKAIPAKKTPKKEKKRDSFILQPLVRSQKKVTKSNPASNSFILFEYCLKLFLSLFKKGRIKRDSPSHGLLGKFVPILIDSLFSKHANLTSTALRLLNQYILKFPDVEEFKESCETIKCNVLVLLDEFIGQGTNSAENIELVTTCFKTISALVRSIETVKLQDDQLKILLFHIDKDLEDRVKQSTAFSLLKAILTKKLESPELKDIMEKLTSTMLHSEQDHVREQCRLIWLKYLINYPLGAQLNNHFLFFVRQLAYPREIGRLAILKLIFSLVKYQDLSQVSENASSFFIPLATRLINDDSIRCRELCSQILQKLISRISLKAKGILFTNVTLPWFQEKLLHRRLAAQLCGIFVQAEGKGFRKRLPQCLPLLVQQLEPTKYPENLEDQDAKRNNDHLLFQLLTFFHKIISTDPDVMDEEQYIEPIKTIFLYVESNYITYPHIWIRVLSIRIVASLFAHCAPEEVSKLLVSKSKRDFYLFDDVGQRLWNLCKKHCFLFSIVYESPEVGDLLVKNLHFIARVYLHIPEPFHLEHEKVKKTKEEMSNGVAEKEEEDFFNKLNLTWLINRLIREIKREIVSHPHDCQARISIFKWIAAVVVEAGVEFVTQNIRTLLIPLCREITNRNLKQAGRLDEENPKQILVQQCLQLYDLIRNKVGADVFSKAYAEVVSLHIRKKNERKAALAVQFLTNPVMALKRKQKKHQAYRASKKLRKSQFRGKIQRVIKRPRLN